MKVFFCWVYRHWHSDSLNHCTSDHKFEFDTDDWEAATVENLNLKGLRHALIPKILKWNVGTQKQVARMTFMLPDGTNDMIDAQNGLTTLIKVRITTLDVLRLI